jgi:GDPmannose 4,6-dehydratase
VLCGDASKARRVLNWESRVGFEELVTLMIDADAELARKERLIAEHHEV